MGTRPDRLFIDITTRSNLFDGLSLDLRHKLKPCAPHKSLNCFLVRLFVDQYVIRYGKETEIFWFGRQAELELEYGAEVEKADNMTLTEMSAFLDLPSLANSFTLWSLILLTC